MDTKPDSAATTPLPVLRDGLTDEPPLIDPFGRTVSYMRVSVTDRCDFRCVYCMSEHMTFLPKKDVLSLEELEAVCTAFVRRGVKKLRLTGGEPLVRRGLMGLINNLARHLDTGALEELTLTTNGTQLPRMADDLYAAGIRRINVSIDTLDPEKFATITRWGKIDQVLAGLDAADKAGLKVKLNAVALKNFNEEEIEPMVRWAHGRGYDMTLIETMPLGEIDGDRTEQYLPLSKVRAGLEENLTLTDLDHKTGGPARYTRVEETGGMLGFITPMTHNFCEGCNRVRLTSTGQLYMCLGQDDDADLRRALREGGIEALDEAIIEAISRKPKGHDFEIERAKPNVSVKRHMSMTGG
jgi:cyclic pyranopterin phosphate synthase